MSPIKVSRLQGGAVLQAFVVTVLWSTSWVLIKIGLKADLPAVSFAGLRYTLALICLLPFVLLNREARAGLHRLSRLDWFRLALLGVVFYSLTQGAQFLGLAYLPAATLSLLLSFTPVFVALFGGLFTRERPSMPQWTGIVLSVAGAVIYFLPLSSFAGQTIGLLVGLAALAANSASSLLGRWINRDSGLSPLPVTAVSMGIGGTLLLGTGAAIQGIGALSFTDLLLIAWLAIVNTAFAFVLWNKSLRTLSAVQSSIINGLMLPQIALLAWVFLAEPLTSRQMAGLVLVMTGAIVVQVWRGRQVGATLNRSDSG
ncbi:MAG TPA: EamA family transporter [Spirochaetia bacterium]|nr:EamA family transporter [Spirochaetia bacterium]